MGKKAYLVGVLALLILALVPFGLYARSTAGESQSLNCNEFDLFGAIVKNSRGEVIGIVNRVENDTGQSFAIIAHGDEAFYGEWSGYTPVPVTALKIVKPGRMGTVVLNRTEKQLKAAPGWDLMTMNDPKYEAKIDKYFGVKG